MGPRLSARRDAGAADRVPPGVRAVVGPLAQGRAERHRRGAPAPRLDAGLGARERAAGRAARSLGGGGRVACGGARRGCWLCGRTAYWAARPGRSASSRSSGASSAGSTRGSGVPTATRPTSRPTSGWTTGSRCRSRRSRSRSRSRSSGFLWRGSWWRADRPAAQVCVRLCDVAPDGASTLVTRGVLNLTHRESHWRAVAARAGAPVRGRR